MKYIGAHVSASGGVFNAPQNAVQISANTFALFTKNQRQWNSKPLTKDVTQKFKDELSKHNFDPKVILPHDSYLINLGNNDKEKQLRSLEAFIDEMQRVLQLGLQLLNFHPGSHLNLTSEEECLDLIANNLNQAIAAVPNIILLIENTAGQGSNLGHSFDHLAHLIDKIKDKDRIQICIDTCHLHAAGYDFTTVEGFTQVFDEFESKIGFNYLGGMHLNDSKNPLGSKKDRHESLGQGYIGWKAFEMIMEDNRFNNIPLILETPNPKIWEQEINQLRSFPSDTL